MIPDIDAPQHELPMLAGIASIIRWFEELLNLVSGPVLTAGLLISLVDLLTDGKLLFALPILLYVWAISQGIGIESNLVAAFDRAKLAKRSRRYWSMAGHLLLGGILAYVGYRAGAVFTVQQANGITVSEALARLGFDGTEWLIERNILAVGLVALSGWTRYHPPAKARPNYAEEAETLRRELELEPLRAQLRARKVLGMRGTIDALRGVESPAFEPHDMPPDDEPPTPPRGGVPQPAPAAPPADLNPIAAQEVRTIVQSMPEAMPVARSSSIVRNAPTGRRRNAPGRRTTSGKRDTSSVKEIVEAVWHPGISLSEIQAATVSPSRPTGISRGAASKWNKFFEATHTGSAESA